MQPITQDIFIFSVLILSTITAFTAGYFLGLYRGSQKKKEETIEIPTQKTSPSNLYEDSSGYSGSPGIVTKPIHSSVMKMPKPSDVRKQKEKESVQSYWDHLAKNKRDKGTFPVDL